MSGRAPLEPGRCAEQAELDRCRRVGPGEAFGFVCAGCGSCCRGRRDLLLSGYDLYRLARRLDLPPRVVAAAFCKQGLGPQTLLPVLRLTPDPQTGDCRFLEGGACLVHPARPLACALYPLGQAIDPVTAQVEYYVQEPLCGAAAGQGRTLGDCLRAAGVLERQGIDARWAVVCTGLSGRLRAAGGASHPRYRTAARRIARALYFDYTTRDEFYPQFLQNIAALEPLLDRLLAR